MNCRQESTHLVLVVSAQVEARRHDRTAQSGDDSDVSIAALLPYMILQKLAPHPPNTWQSLCYSGDLGRTHPRACNAARHCLACDLHQ